MTVVTHYIPGQAASGPGVDPTVGGDTAPLVRYFITTTEAEKNAIATAVDGDICYVTDSDVPYWRAAGAWVPARVLGDSITDVQLAENSVGTSELKVDAVETENIATDAVTGAEIADNAIGPEHIQADAVGSSEIAALAVGTGELADNAVTGLKIGSLKGGVGVGSTSGGSNVFQVVPLTEHYDSHTFHSAANPTRITAPEAGVYLVFGYISSGGTNFISNYLQRNGANFLAQAVNPMTWCFAYPLAAGDYFEIGALWDNGAFSTGGSLGMLRIG